MIDPSETPAWPTALRSRLRDGRLMGGRGGLWYYRRVPMSPVTDAKTGRDMLNAGAPLGAAFEEIAALTSTRGNRRALSKRDYRKFHTLLVNIPVRYEAERSNPLWGYLNSAYGDQATNRRVLLFGVQLRDKIGSGGLKDMIASVSETLLYGEVPLSDFDEDFERIQGAFDRAGLLEASTDDVRLANSWWNHGYSPDVPTMAHADHIHFFTDIDAVNTAERAGADQCHTWADKGVTGQHAISFASISDLDLDFIDDTDPLGHWGSHLIGAGALAVSIRGLIEPSRVTREELRRSRRKYIEDITEHMEQGKMSRAEHEEKLATLTDIEGLYAAGGAPPTLVDTSVLVGFNGQVGDVEQRLPNGSPAKVQIMAVRQPGAFAEMQVTSPQRANPNLLELPAQTVAHSGLPSLNRAGDKVGAMLGFDERDRQPVYVSPTAAASQDSVPLMIGAGDSGSGKTQMGINLLSQWVRGGSPGIFIDPSPGSDLSDAIEGIGGQTASLDELAEADGIFDPLRFAQARDVGIDLAASTLMQLNPWGTDRENMEVPIQRAISYGVERGATSTGQALLIARKELPNLPPEMVDRVLDLATSSALARACVGMDPHTRPLSVADGATLVKVGSAHLDLPDPGHPAETLSQRVTVALVRAMIFGSAMSLMGRPTGGVVVADEAWTFLAGVGGRAAVERLGRLARKWNVLPFFLTQRVTDFVDAGLAGFISRGMILPLSDRDEAIAACELFRLEPTPERLDRIMAPKTLGGVDGVAPNFASMHALRDPDTKKVLRGSVAIHVDLAKRAIPTEIYLPPAFLAQTSSNPEDVARRNAAREAARASALAGSAV